MRDESLIPLAAMRAMETIIRLGEAPVINVVGVITGEDVSGIRVNQQEKLTLLFALNPWRECEGPVQSRTLQIRQAVTDEEFNRLSSLLRRHSVVQLRARVIDDPELDEAQGLLESFVSTDVADDTLGQCADDMRVSDAFEDEQFGNFFLDRGGDTFTADVDWNGEEIELSISGRQRSASANALQQARRLWSNVAAWDDRVRDFAAESLLPIKNSTWRGIHEPKLSAREFRSHLTLNNVFVADDGEFLFQFDDGGMFQGNVIVVRGYIDQGLLEADLAG
ncbi:hypothetical protein ETAA8_11770 [Anatilimnocola aggregata]|uniref:Uncharacterized protein n=1 Tax=Anatilimnocola aggregata TaxID=2528021 RepID=A0A517Y786_9BACT|nr:DUF2262 domain-containing protein [Anatilimnocola aggregata]QDU26103.1 hypothetical protein ETAA8_11770 [Anatilimnocola aggregata]